MLKLQKGHTAVKISQNWEEANSKKPKYVYVGWGHIFYLTKMRNLGFVYGRWRAKQKNLK